MRKLLIYCNAGFGNRFNSLVAGMALANCMGIDYEVFWPINNQCAARFELIFTNEIVIRQERLSDLAGTLNDCIVPSHDEYNANLLQVEYQPIYDFQNLTEFMVYAGNNDKNIFFYPAIIPGWIPADAVLAAVHQLCFQPSIMHRVDTFVQQSFPNGYYGIHLRRTDLNIGLENDELAELLERYPDKHFFVCSDSPEAERFCTQYLNVHVLDKHAYVEKLVKQDEWNALVIDSDQQHLPFNVYRNENSVVDAVVDLLILSHANIIGDIAHSTFVSVAKMLGHAFPYAPSSLLPPIEWSPVKDFVSRANRGMYDLTEIIVFSTKLKAMNRHKSIIKFYLLLINSPRFSRNAAVLFQYAYQLLDQGLQTEAEWILRQAILLDRNFLQPYLMLGVVLYHQGERVEALYIWSQALAHATNIDINLRKLILSEIQRVSGELLALA